VIGRHRNASSSRCCSSKQVPRYDAISLTAKLRAKCGKPNGQFDWLSLGVQAGACFNKAMASVQFLSGPLESDATVKERKKPVRRAKDDIDEVEEEQPEDVKEHAKNGDQLSAVERNIKELRTVLRKKCEQKQKRQLEEIQNLPEEDREPARKKLQQTQGEICAVQYLFNPKSFTQTIENVFHFSFMVKDGVASMTTRKDGDEPGIKIKMAAEPTEDEARPKGPSKQTITSLDMRDWKRLCKAYNVTQGDIPHRTGSKHVKRDGVSQVFE
jgi:non-structural maintenance of chromosomes element 4